MSLLVHCLEGPNLVKKQDNNILNVCFDPAEHFHTSHLTLLPGKHIAPFAVAQNAL